METERIILIVASSMSTFPSTLGSQVIKNSLSVFLRGGAQAAFVVFVTPYILHRLGKDNFGIWSLIYVFIAYSALFDFGVSGALAKFTGGLEPGRDGRKIKPLLNSALAILSLLCLLVVCGLIAVGSWYSGQTVAGHSALQLALLAGLLFAAAMFANLLMYALLGIQRQDLGSYVATCFTFLSALGIVALLAAGIRLEGLILFSVFNTLLMGGVGWIVFFRQVQGPPSKQVDREQVAHLLGFGWRLQIYAFVSIFYQYFGKFFLAYSLSLAAVAHYELALRLVTQVRQGLSSLAGSLLPATARLQGEGNTALMGQFYFYTLKYISLLSIPLFGSLCFFALPLINCWVGGGYEESASVLRILAPGFYAGTLSSVTWFFMVGGGMPGVGTLLALFETALGVGSTLLFAPRYGLEGAAFAASLAACVSLPVYLWRYQRQVSYPWLQLLWQGFAFPILICVALAVPTQALLQLLPSRLGQLIGILAYIFACYAAFVPFRVVRNDEQRPVREWMRREWRGLVAGGQL